MYVAGHFKATCLLNCGKVTTYHAAFTLAYKGEISDELKLLGVGYIYSTGDKYISYNSGVKYRFYISTEPRRLKIRRRLYRDLINELKNAETRRLTREDR